MNADAFGRHSFQYHNGHPFRSFAVSILAQSAPVFHPAQKVFAAPLEIPKIGWYTEKSKTQEGVHSTYVYRGRSEIYGTVTYRGAPVEGAAVTAHRYINHVLVPVTNNEFADNEIVVMHTNRNGKFFMPDDLKSQKRLWGTYVVRIDYQGETYYAQVNFHGTDGFGSVDIGNKLTPVATPVPTPKAEQTPTPTQTASPTPAPDCRAMLETYLRQVLIPDHNLLVQYADTLRPYGMQRNDQRIWVDELYDAQQSQKYSVQDLFSNSGSITWVAELDTCYEFSYRTAQKVVVAIDYADLAH